MADNRKNDPFQYNFDEEWDVEQVLYGHLLNKPKEEPRHEEYKREDHDFYIPGSKKRTVPQENPKAGSNHPLHAQGDTRRRKAFVVPNDYYESTPNSGHGSGKPASGTRMPPQPRKTTAHKRPVKKKKNWDYRKIAVYGAMGVTAILALIFVIWLIVWLVSPGKGGKDEDSADSSTVETIPTTTVDYDAIAADLLEEADLQSAMYDYDKAIATVKSFGSGWSTRSDLTQAVQKYEELKSQTVRWADTTTIPHIFFHILVADNSRAFDGDYTEAGYNQYMTTIPEFKAILEELYARDYVLIRIHDIAKLVTNESGQQVYEQGDIYLPPGKKPIVISQDDVNFYEYMIDSDGDHLPDADGDGFASKLLVDAHGDITCEYVTAEGEVVYGDYDLVPILERFVEEHPDFSYHGAKAIVALTGYEGVYGYRTDKDGKARLTPEEFQKEINGAKAVNQWLKDNGWEIASHSYGHPSYGSLTWEELAHDVSRWEEEVQPVVGDTDIFIYPYGSDIAGVENYSGAKYDTMYAAGYRFFCNVDSSEYWVHIRNNYVRQGRRNLDGYRMWYDPELLDDLFDATAVFDPDRPTPVPPI